MTAIGLSQFNGIIPRIYSGDLPAHYAEKAIDVRLENGSLRPWRELKSIISVDSTVRSIYQWGCCWLPFDKCSDVTEWLANCPRIIVTDWADYPVFIPISQTENGDCKLGNDCCPTWSRLGVIAPNNAPIATSTQAPNYDKDKQDIKTVRYVYTYENCFCEESAPSYPSENVDTNEGVPIVISGISAPPQGWCINKINIYRLESSYDKDTSKKVQSHETNYFKAGSIDINKNSFVDTTKTVDLGSVLLTKTYSPPPDNLRGIRAVYGTTFLVGFHDGNKIRFSHHGQCHNFPESEMLLLDDNIISLESDSSGFIHVMTDGSPYCIQADAGCEELKARTVIRHKEAIPAVVCATGRGSLSTPLGSIYVSSYGLTLLRGNLPPVVITKPWFGVDDWRLMKPETMRLGYYSGSIFCISDTVGFIFTLNSDTFPHIDSLKLSSISDRPKAMFTNRQGELFMLFDDEVKQWDAGDKWRPYTWKSKTFETPEATSWGMGRIHSKGTVKLSVYTDNNKIFSDNLPSQLMFRLPPHIPSFNHSIEVNGIHEVNRIRIATSGYDLTEGSN